MNVIIKRVNVFVSMVLKEDIVKNVNLVITVSRIVENVIAMNREHKLVLVVGMAYVNAMKPVNVLAVKMFPEDVVIYVRNRRLHSLPTIHLVAFHASVLVNRQDVNNHRWFGLNVPFHNVKCFS